MCPFSKEPNQARVMSQFSFAFLAIVISLLFSEPVSAAELKVQLRGLVFGGQQNEYIVLRDVSNGSIFFPTQISTDKISKLRFRTQTTLPGAPILKWKKQGEDRFVGNVQMARTFDGYQAVLYGDMQWTGQIDALALIFPFSAKEILISLEYSAGKADAGDALRLFFQPELIKPFTINTLAGHQLFGLSLTRLLGGILVLIAIGTWVVFFGDKKRQQEILLITLAILWALFDLRFNVDIWSNYRSAAADLPKGNYFTVTDFLPLLRKVSEAVPHKIGTKVEYIGPDLPYRQYLEYELIPTKITRNQGIAEYIFLLGTQYSVAGNTVIVNEKQICNNCVPVFETSDATLFMRKH